MHNYQPMQLARVKDTSKSIYRGIVAYFSHFDRQNQQAILMESPYVNCRVTYFAVDIEDIEPA